MHKITQDTKQRMVKSIELLGHELTKLRTGRAHPSLLDHIKVSYYGTPTSINQVANVAVEGARMLVVTPWEKNLISAVEKAIRESDLGLNPTNVGSVIRIPLPQLSEERRKELVKVTRDEGEHARVAIRTIRRDANQEIKALIKDKKMTEDEGRRLELEVQKLTDSYVAEVEEVLQRKETDLMEI